MLANLPTNLKVVAVTKNRSVDEITQMLGEMKITAIAENRLAEAKEKFAKLPKDLSRKLEKHFIGKLQSRKIKEIVMLFDVIQSVESLEQAEKISTCAQKLSKTTQIMLQVNIANLPQRSGCKVENAGSLISSIQKLPNIKLIGVMGIAEQDKTAARHQFQTLKSIQRGLAHCSMGMSDDYQIAIKEGSTMLRLGRALFE